MTVVVSSDCDRIETVRPAFVPLTEVALQDDHRPAHNRVICASCERQVNPGQAVRTSEGYLHKKCAEDDFDWS